MCDPYFVTVSDTLAGEEQTSCQTVPRSIWMLLDASGISTRLTSPIAPVQGVAGIPVPDGRPGMRHQAPTTIESDWPDWTLKEDAVPALTTLTVWNGPFADATLIVPGRCSTQLPPPL